jgi:hypothetical protein
LKYETTVATGFKITETSENYYKITNHRDQRTGEKTSEETTT